MPDSEDTKNEPLKSMQPISLDPDRLDTANLIMSWNYQNLCTHLVTTLLYRKPYRSKKTPKGKEDNPTDTDPMI